jgi:hypothetical protein
MFDKDWVWDLFLLNASEPISPQGFWTNVREQYLTGAYIISRDGVKYILNNFAGKYRTSDWMTSDLQARGRSYSYFPTESTIGSSYEPDHEKVV